MVPCRHHFRCDSRCSPQAILAAATFKISPPLLRIRASLSPLQADAPPVNRLYSRRRLVSIRFAGRRDVVIRSSTCTVALVHNKRKGSS
ncbi:hypothetical protein BV22DRAFT_903996 [Leucogyrophana mollusca]|uniref:Uncharacterized protein n=1 Tax=Leucogyrophana mollusca TaxID=85980 RepID=A0ACB8AYU8_9AGAM|nr:hypothetical protein BV22DRAFT_903996 [Leucogyrophana mollusca]